MMADDPYTIDLTRSTYASDPECDPMVSLSYTEAETLKMFWQWILQQDQIIVPNVAKSGMEKIISLLQPRQSYFEDNR